MKAINLLLNSFLPPELQDPVRIYDKKGLEKLMGQVATKYPDQYSGIVQKIADVGRHAAYHQGETLTLNDFRPVLDKDTILAKMDQEVAKATMGLTNPKAIERAKIDIWSRYGTELEKATLDAALAQRNNLGSTVVSGARGNPLQLKSMITTPALYTDYKDNPIPLFVRHSFGEGLRPAEYLASTFGVRKSVISTKSATADAGDLSKQMSAAAAPLVVTTSDCGTSNGLDFDAHDPELEGRVVAKTYGDVHAGDILDRRSIADLNRQGVKTVVARSPMTCQAKEGICAHCHGTLATGKFPTKGYAAGITAANALGEPLTQGALNTKHTAGASKGAKKTFSGFNVINQLMQSPEVFPFKAAVAELPGRVESVEAAPQGGSYVTVAGQKHYVLPDYEINVKPGDNVEAGDQLSDGVMDPSDVVRLRGLGEGRRYYVDRLRQAFDESGAGKPSRLNLELMARATLDHVRIDQPSGKDDYLPDDIASYNRLASDYVPADDTKLVPVKHAVGKRLQSPMLHFSIGTELTPKMVSHLERAGYAHAPVSSAEPTFVPEMVRLRSSAHNNPDWLARLHSSYLTTGLNDSASRSRDTDTNSNVHFAAPLMRAKDFGKNVQTTGKF